MTCSLMSVITLPMLKGSIDSIYSPILGASRVTSKQFLGFTVVLQCNTATLQHSDGAAIRFGKIAASPSAFSTTKGEPRFGMLWILGLRSLRSRRSAGFETPAGSVRAR
jgi:hypothetical protein